MISDGAAARVAPEPWSRTDAAIVAVLAVVAAVLLTWSYGRMLHPIIDSGRDLYIPGRLLAGQKLYADIRYFYPPLAPYLLAAITAIIGRGLGSYYAIGFVVSAVVAATVFVIGRRFGGRWTAAAASLLVISWSLTGATARGCNFFFPYAHAATFGMMFFLLYLLLLAKYLFGSPGHEVTGSPGAFFVALLPALAASWSKIEFAAFVAFTLVLALLVRRFAFGDSWGSVARLAIGAAAASGLTIAITELFFAGAPPGHHWFRDGVFWTPLVNGPITRRFYAAVIGLDDWRRNLLTSLLSAVLVALIAAIAVMISRSRKAVWLNVLGIAAVVLVSIPLANQRFFRAWSVLQLVVGAVALVRTVRSWNDRAARDEHLRTLFLLVFALCCASRIYLNLAPFWYGFAFIIPTEILIAHVLFSYGPSLGLYSRRAALIWLIPIALVAMRGMAEQHFVDSTKRFPISTARGVFFDDVADRASALNGFLSYVAHRGARSLVVMPEGIALNYFLEIPDPLSYNTFSAAEIATPEVERDVVREIEAKKPELIALDNQYVREFGVAEFGFGYGRQILDDIRAHYAVERTWRTPTFSIVLLRRVR